MHHPTYRITHTTTRKTTRPKQTKTNSLKNIRENNNNKQTNKKQKQTNKTTTTKYLLKMNGLFLSLFSENEERRGWMAIVDSYTLSIK